MIHEAMILEYSGRHLALMELAAQLKFTIYAVLIANLFFPWGISQSLAPGALLLAVFSITAKLTVLGAFLALSETTMAKMRLFRVPTFLAVAFTLSLLGMLSFIMLEGH